MWDNVFSLAAQYGVSETQVENALTLAAAVFLAIVAWRMLSTVKQFFIAVVWYFAVAVAVAFLWERFYIRAGLSSNASSNEEGEQTTAEWLVSLTRLGVGKVTSLLHTTTSGADNSS